MLTNIIQCTSCQKDVIISGQTISCNDCGVILEKKHGVWVSVLNAENELPPFYKNPDWKKYHTTQALFHQTYYSEKTFSNFLEKQFKKKIFSLAENVTYPVLDFGCGSGKDIDIIPDHNKVVAIDLHFESLCEAKKRHGTPDYIQTDISGALFKKDIFKTIFALGVLEHVFELESAVKALADVLHPHGMLYVMIPTEGGAATMARRLYTAPKYSKKFGYNYGEALKIEHCNTCFAVENALKKWFVIDQKKGWPSNTTDSFLNLVWTYRLTQRL